MLLLGCTPLADDLLRLDIVSEHLLVPSELTTLPAEAKDARESVDSSSCSNITSESLLDTSVENILARDVLESIDRCPLISYLCLHDRDDEDMLVMEARDSFPTSTELVREVAKSEYLEDVTLVMDGREALDILVMEDDSSPLTGSSTSSASEGYSGSGEGVGFSENSWLVGSGVGVGVGVTLSARLPERSDLLGSRSFCGSAAEVMVGVGLRPRISVHNRISRVSILALQLEATAPARLGGAHMAMTIDFHSATCS